MSGAYREPAGVEPDPPPVPKPAMERIGPLRKVHATPPLSRALIAPVIFGVFVEGMGLLVGIPWLLITPFAFIVFFILGRPALRLRGVAVEVHSEGLVLCREEERRAVVFEDVDEVWFEIGDVQGRAGAALRKLRLVDHQGLTYHVPLGVLGAPALVDAVLRATSAPMMTEAKQALAEGEKLTFRRVVVDRAGIEVNGARLAWSEIRLAVVSQGKVSLYGRMPLFAWRTVRLDGIPHPTVFLALLHGCVGKVRVDDAILIPFATSAEEKAALAAQGATGAMYRMVFGGVLVAVGLLTAVLTYSRRDGTLVFGWGLIGWGAVMFCRALQAYLSDKDR